MNKLPEPFVKELGINIESMITFCFNTELDIFKFSPKEMQKCLEMLYVYGYEF